MLARRLPAAGSTATLPLGPPQSRTCVRLWTVREGSDSHPSDGIGRLPSWRGPSTRSEDHGPMVTPAEAPGAARASHARTPAPPPPREDQPRRFRRTLEVLTDALAVLALRPAGSPRGSMLGLDALPRGALTLVVVHVSLSAVFGDDRVVRSNLHLRPPCASRNR